MGILVSMLVFYFGIYEVYGVESMQLIRSKHWIQGVSSHEVRIDTRSIRQEIQLILDAMFQKGCGNQEINPSP